MNEYEQPGEELPAGEISTPVLPEKPRFSASIPEILTALACYVLGRLWFEPFIGACVDPTWLPVFVAVFIAQTEWLHRGTPRTKESWIWLGCIFVLTLAVMLDRCRAWGGSSWPGFFLHVFAIWWVLSRGGRLAEGKSGHMLPYDALNGFIVFPFKHFFLRIRCLWYGLTRLGRGEKRLGASKLLWSIGAILAAVLLLIRAAVLLQRADDAFGTFLSGIADSLASLLDEEERLYLLFSLPVGAYIFGLIAGSAREDPEAVRARGRRLMYRLSTLRKVPVPVFTAALGVFALFYLGFFILQGSYLFGAFTRTLPEGFVVAEYARQGFFELCRVMALNFALLWLASRFAEKALKDDRLLRVFAAVLLGESLLFAVIAASKLGLYIDCFGFTPLRLQSSWLVCVLAAGCGCALYSLCTGKKSFRAWMIFGAVTLSLLCLY